MGFVVFIKNEDAFTDLSQTNISIILGVRKEFLIVFYPLLPW